MSEYLKRIDRNLGVISPKEQEILHNSCVAIAGCGGMGGLVAIQLSRIGVGRIKIADGDIFEASNLNRQYAAKQSTLGVNKAEATFAEIISIAPDTKVDVFSQGVNSTNVKEFISGADVICDEIEFFQIAPRIQLHREARIQKVNVLNCNVVGFGTRIFLFSPDSMTMEDFLEADENTELTENVIIRLIQRLAPQLPLDISEAILKDWVLKQNKAPIFGGTPPISSGILVVRICLEILGVTSRPWIANIPKMPGYAYFDAGTFESGIKVGKWW